MIKDINFKQPKYVLPTIAYFGGLFLGYLFSDVFGTEIKDDEDNGLQTTEYLNSELPSANVSDDIGSKRKNVTDIFGNVMDNSAVEDIENDQDSVNKKEDYESKYSEEELKRVQEQHNQAEEIKQLKKALAESAKKGSQISSVDNYVLPMTDEERSNALMARRNGLLNELDRDLNNVRSRGVSEMGAIANAQDSIGSAKAGGSVTVDPRAVHATTENTESQVVVKATKDNSRFFHYGGKNTAKSNLIKAIIDEEVKAVEGSRVRLRLLDDIEIGDVKMKRNSYLYATMSGFAQQRVQGKVSSVMVGDEILKISLSIYDVTDGQEGLYVPASAFRETAQDIGSSAMQGGMNMNNSYGGNSMTQWANQAMQNAYQRTSNAISKAIKKNKVRLKYGTQVYLINSEKRKER